jgi:hypothetical protein
MQYPLWLKIWLGVLGIAVLIAYFPYIVMYFKVNQKPIWKMPFWQTNRIAKFLIPLPQGGYSREMWAAIRSLPLLCFAIGVGYFLFVGLFVANHVWALPLGLMILPLVLHGIYLFDFGMDAEWYHGGFTARLFLQEALVSECLCPETE